MKTMDNKMAWIAPLIFAIVIGRGWGQVSEKAWRGLENPKTQRHLVRLAYAVITATVRGKSVSHQLANVRPYITLRAGCFVTIERGTNLRGCMGTLFPTQKTLTDEIFQAAVAACRDKRYPPITPDELPRLSVSITVVKRLTPLDDIRSLRPDDGLVVRRGEKIGVVLPHEGKDPLVRLEWGKRKASLSDGEPFEMWRMEAVRWRCWRN